MSKPTKVRLRGGKEYTFNYSKRWGTLLSVVQELAELDDIKVASEDEYEILPESSYTKSDWLEHVEQELENGNYHSEIRIVSNATAYMTDEKAVEYLKQVMSVMP